MVTVWLIEILKPKFLEEISRLRQVLLDVFIKRTKQSTLINCCKNGGMVRIVVSFMFEYGFHFIAQSFPYIAYKTIHG